MVKAKGNVNMSMAQLVEVALEEESAIRTERFKRNIPEKGQFGNQEARYVPRRPHERKEVSVATFMCYRCNKQGYIARHCREKPSNVGENHAANAREIRNKSGNGQRLPWQPKAELAPRGCEDNKKKSADSGLAVFIEVKDNVTTEVGNESVPQKLKIALPHMLVLRVFHQKLKIMLLQMLVVRVLSQKLIMMIP
jgi:hypothetical protein